MDAHIENPSDDTGTLVVHLSRDDDAAMVKDTAGVTLRLPLYAHEAHELIETLTPLAQREAV